SRTLLPRPEDELPITDEEPPAQPSGSPIRRSRSEIAAESPRQNNAPQTVPALRCPVSGRRNHDLAGNGKHRTLQGHQEDNAGISPVIDPLKPDTDPLLHLSSLSVVPPMCGGTRFYPQ